MKNETTRPQEVPTPKTVNRTTFYLSIALTFFATGVITTIACWFLFINVHSDARAAVIQDMKIVSKAQEQ